MRLKISIRTGGDWHHHPRQHVRNDSPIGRKFVEAPSLREIRETFDSGTVVVFRRERV